MLEFGRWIRDAGDEGGQTLGSEEEDARVARRSFFIFVAVSLVSGAETLRCTTTDTPDVEVDALSILGADTAWAGSL